MQYLSQRVRHALCAVLMLCFISFLMVWRMHYERRLLVARLRDFYMWISEHSGIAFRMNNSAAGLDGDVLTSHMHIGTTAARER